MPHCSSEKPVSTNKQAMVTLAKVKRENYLKIHYFKFENRMVACTLIHFNQGCIVPIVWLKWVLWFWMFFFYPIVNVFSLCGYNFSFEKALPFIWTNLNPLNSKMLCREEEIVKAHSTDRPQKYILIGKALKSLLAQAR